MWLDHDLTKNGQVNGEPIGERIVVSGKVLDENGRGMKGILLEIWQCNSAGRYIHREEIHDAPLDPNFLGAGRVITGDDGSYKFITIKPGSYPWGNHHNAWRPAHIHFSVFGLSFIDRLVTQMYFEGDPTFAYDPIYNAISDAEVRERMVAKFSIDETVPDWAHAYRFDIVLRGRKASWFEGTAHMSTFKQTPSQTVGPFFAYGLTAPQYNYDFTDVANNDLRVEGVAGEPITITGQVLDGSGVSVNDALVEIWQADGEGAYPTRQSNAAFKGFGRMGTGTDPQNRFLFQTVKPGAVAEGQAPHVSVIVFMRGGLNHHHTRIYFEGEAANEVDPVLQSVPENRRHTLVAKPGENGSWHFDIHMQGEDETVFFDV